MSVMKHAGIVGVSLIALGCGGQVAPSDEQPVDTGVASSPRDTEVPLLDAIAEADATCLPAGANCLSPSGVFSPSRCCSLSCGYPPENPKNARCR